MTVLHLDQPRQLRLVRSSSSAPNSAETRRSSQQVFPNRGRARGSRYRQQAQLSSESRRLLHDVLCGRLAAGQPINADAVRVILAARQTNHSRSAHWFTSELIWQLVFVDIVAWCRTRRLAVPEQIPAALAAIVLQLHVSEQLDAASDPIGELLNAIDECTGIDSSAIAGSALPPPVGSIRSRGGHSRKQPTRDV